VGVKLKREGKCWRLEGESSTKKKRMKENHRAPGVFVGGGEITDQSNVERGRRQGHRNATGGEAQG